MHCLASTLVGILLAAVCVALSPDRLMALAYSPFIVSATIITLGLLPERRRGR